MAKTKQKDTAKTKKEVQPLHKIQGFISEYDGREVSFDEYIDSAKRGEEPGSLPVPVLEGIKNMILDQENVNGGFRVTSMLGCIRQLYFETKIGTGYIKPSSYYPMFRGIMAHKVMEDFKIPGAVDEKRFTREWKGVKITGKPDRIVPSEKAIDDYKTTEKVPEFGRVYKSHEKQLNLYRWLVGEEYQIDNLRLIYMDMKTAKIMNARVWSDPELEAFLDEKVEKIKNAFDKNQIPPYEKIWLCDYCQHTVQCREHALNTFLDQLAERVEKGESLSKAEIVKRMKNLTIL